MNNRKERAFDQLKRPVALEHQKWDDSTISFVSISCITYNHEKFIRNTLNGFLSQKTSFKVEILIHDDASSDGTADIIREYESKFPDLIKPIYQQENQYSKGVRGMSRTFNYPRAEGVYIALCEGDDYWTDPLKLQKQVEFLETNTDYSLTCGGYISNYNGLRKERISVDNPFKRKETEHGFEFGLEVLKHGWITKTLTLLFRYDREILNALDEYKYTRDVHFVYHLLKDKRGYYFKEIFGVYTVHSGGVQSMLDTGNHIRNVYLIYKELYKKNGDHVSRWMYRKYALALLNYKLFRSRKVTSESTVKLWREALFLTKNFKEFKSLILCFFPEEKKAALKESLGGK